MVKKLCPKCGKYSYSAATRSKWTCPSCGHDLSSYPHMEIEQSDQERGKAKCALKLIVNRS